VDTRPSFDTAPPARLVIRHEERDVAQQAPRSREATTNVYLTVRGQDRPAWHRRFSLSADFVGGRRGTSILFGPNATPYWSTFFVPIATWDTKTAVGPLVSLGRDAVAVDAAGDRAVALFDNGDFQLIHLANPAMPVILVERRSPESGKRMSGIRLARAGVAVFGEDGLEWLRLSEKGPSVVKSFGRDTIGSVSDLVEVDDGLVLSTRRGMIHIPWADDGLGLGEPRRLRRAIPVGLAMSGENLVWTDGRSRRRVSASLCPPIREPTSSRPRRPTR
jgi:hypothetical protein